MAQAGEGGTEDLNLNKTDIKAKISHIEAEIAETKARLKSLERELEDQKCLIASVRNIPIELLSMIFEMCNEEDWKSPVRIAGVCRQWQNAIFVTPSAWIHIGLPRSREIGLLTLYIKRSYPLLIHLAIPPISTTFWLEGQRLLDENSHRVVCINASLLCISGVSFPRLCRLRLPSPSERASFAQFTAERFPSLHHLEASFCMRDLSGITFARIQQLCVTVDSECAWPTVLTHLRATLVTLKIHLRRDFDLSPAGEFKGKVDLPNLRYLHVASEDPLSYLWNFSANTPRLQTHIHLGVINDHGDTYYVVEVDVGQVTHLVIPEPGSAPLDRYHKLRSLRLGYHPEKFIEKLHQKNELCPSLTCIEYMCEEEPLGDLELTMNASGGKCKVIQRIHRGDGGAGGDILVIWRPFLRPWEVDLPYGMAEMCGRNMGCTAGPDIL